MSDQEKLYHRWIDDDRGLHACLSPGTDPYIATNGLDRHTYYWCKSCAARWDAGKFRRLTSEEALIIEVMES